MRFKNRLSFYLAISLLLHLLIILYLNFLPENKISPESAKPIEITVIENPKIDQTLDQAKQIVEQDDKPVNNEIDPNAKYLSQFNQKVVQQTSAAQTGDFNNKAGHGLQNGKKVERTAKNENMIKPQEKGDFGQRLEKFMPKMDWTAMAEKNLGGDHNDVSRTSDYLKDVAKGAETQLTTKQFLYYAYFKRINTQIKHYWEASIKEKVEKLVKSGRTIASDQNRMTKLLIILDRNGTLTNVRVLGESGYKDLDDAGIEAFKAAAPFPNPPTGLIEKDGTVRIRYDFVVES